MSNRKTAIDIAIEQCKARIESEQAVLARLEQARDDAKKAKLDRADRKAAAAPKV
jgi:hypothetical protein